MKKIRYSAGMKAIALLLQELFSIVLVICILLVSVLFNKSMLDMGDLKNKPFTESVYFQELFQGTLEEVLSYIEYQEQFETDGEYNPEKAVNIMAYRNSNETAKVKSPLAGSEKFRYYLIDLENWSKDYVQLSSMVESRLYFTQDGALHQAQTVYVDGKTVRESDVVIQSLQDMDKSLQEIIVTEVQYYYGGYYNLEEYQQKSTDIIDSKVFTEISEETAVGYQDTDGIDASADALDEQTQATAEAVNPTDVYTPEQQLQDSIQKIRDGRLFELETDALAGVLKDLKLDDASAVINGYVLEEKYLTVDQGTILDEFLSGALTLQEMQLAYESLQYTLDTIGDEITAYKRLVNKYEKNSSNIQFGVYVEGQNQYFSNIADKENREDLLDYGKRLGSYFYYNKNDIRLDTNVDGMEDVYYERYESRNGGHNSVVFVGIDKSFPYEDNLYKARSEYNRLQPWGMFSLTAAVISAFGCFLTFIYLSLAAGRRPEDDEIHLIWFDRIKTEILIAATGMVCIGIVFVMEGMVSLLAGSDLVGMMIMAGGIVFTIVALFMAFYSSFVRRIKAGVMWTGSLMYWFGSGIRKIVKNWRPSLKILTAFGLHTLLLLTLGMLLVYGRLSYLGAVMVFIGFLLLTGAEAVIFLREGIQRNAIIRGIKRIAGGELEYEIDTSQLKGENKYMGQAVNTIGEGLYHAVDDSTKNERLKADLITNVSHDIKTPLTSIINYVDLLKREDLQNERAKGFIRVLDVKSQRLKQLTEDLVEASKVSSGNITLQMDRLNFVELVYQTAGEFNEKFEDRGLTAVTKLPKDPVIIMADGRRIWRVIENLYNNVAKYAMENTRVYVDMEVLESAVAFSIKNISEQALNIDASELTERFIRGDVSRSTEGSGLGLSIAKSLTQLMGGTFDVYLDGDLFKVTVTFPLAMEE